MDHRPASGYLHRTLDEYRAGGFDPHGGYHRFGSEETCLLQIEDCKLKIGAMLTDVLANNINKEREVRCISGNVLTGKQIPANGFLGAFHSQVTVIPEGNDVHEMLGWIMPRTNDFSVSHSYFSWLMGKKKEYVLDARIKGGERHMIMSNEYDKVLPMDILPEYLIKANYCRRH